MLVVKKGKVYSTEILEVFGKNIRLVRKLSGLTLKEVAREVGIVSETLSKIERGQSNTDFITAYKIAQTLDVSLDSLLKEG